MITKRVFGEHEGKDVYLFTITNKNGASTEVMNLGATLVSVKTPDKNGVMADVVCGYDNAQKYLISSGFQGATIGRFANRIANSRFELDGKEFILYNNEGNNHIHGGKNGFDKKIWDFQIENKDSSVKFIYLSKDGEEGYPGNLTVSVTYTFNENNELSIDYYAICDKNTVINLTNHSYFNLGGYNSGSIEDHYLWIDSDKITEIDDKLIPTGKYICVENTPFDFRKEKKIGQDIDDSYPQLQKGKGYDHNFVLNNNGKLKHCLTLFDPKSERRLRLFTNQPGIQIYTANCVNEDDTPFKNNVPQKKRCAVALETQHFPNTPNITEFPSCKLKKGEQYHYTTIYKFEK